jgi:hypothetical protein
LWFPESPHTWKINEPRSLLTLFAAALVGSSAVRGPRVNAELNLPGSGIADTRKMPSSFARSEIQICENHSPAVKAQFAPDGRALKRSSKAKAYKGKQAGRRPQ